MKFCAIICEYNPFHNGHLYQMNEARTRSGCDGILCVMSGNFTQRGEAAIIGKYRRARHAVENGADAVIELPAAFSVSPAELFARGAVHLLHGVPSVRAISFGCENGTAEEFLSAANATRSEDKMFKTALKDALKDGTSYIRARAQTILAYNPELDPTLFLSPNNILGLEYCRAMLEEGCDLSVIPVERVGSGYTDSRPRENFSSASALRLCLAENTRKSRILLRRNLPACVYSDLLAHPPASFPFREAALCALLRADPKQIADTPDCSEGLENRLIALAKTNHYDGVVQKTVSKRYTAARIRRILMQNFLGITLKETRNFLSVPLYRNVLAVRKSGAEKILSALSEGESPLIVRRSDVAQLRKFALACFERDIRSNDLYHALTGTCERDCETLFV